MTRIFRLCNKRNDRSKFLEKQEQPIPCKINSLAWLVKTSKTFFSKLTLKYQESFSQLCFLGNLSWEWGSWCENSLSGHFWPDLDPDFCLKGPNVESLKQNFNFQSVRNTEATLLPNLTLIQSKNLKNNYFLLFLIQNGQRFCPNFLQMWVFLAVLALNLHSGISTQVPILSTFKCISHARYEKTFW